jgi:Uma2 family endonuclease
MSVFIEDDAPAVDRLPPAVPEFPILRLSVQQYHEMIHAGILTEDDRVELLDGWMVSKMTKNPPHSSATRLVRHALERIVPRGWMVDSQEAITLATSEPEPDVVVARGDDQSYLDHHPGPKDVALVVEVADVSLKRDRTLKKRLYAEAGIPVYWIVNLVDRCVEVYSDPSGPADRPDYREHRDGGPTDEVAFTVEGHEVGRLAVGSLLP